uniref:ER membrane protein complex subunit 2 n=1 Tax=Cucumis sativus TaxID=3659 RepID=A0A0A0LE87_CUCSA
MAVLNIFFEIGVGAAVTSAELGEYAQAASLLEDLIKEKSDDSDIFRLLGEVKYKLKDYDGSVAAYKSATKLFEDVNFEVLRGLTNSLLAAGKPDEAVQFLLDYRDNLNNVKLGEGKEMETKLSIDPVQVDLLLGKSYSDWGHVSDAVSVYDQLISSHPNDFRGYLAKVCLSFSLFLSLSHTHDTHGIILKENGRSGDAERMFIQARFFAPENAKMLVDRYSR